MTTLKELHTLEELNTVIEESAERPVILFKHSRACPISASAFREFQEYLKTAGATISHNLITVQTDRPVSDEAARRLGVIHETPQIILIEGGRPTWNASHFRITADTIKEAVTSKK